MDANRAIHAKPNDRQNIVRLMTWLSPSFPVGAYSYSHGIEYAVEAGLIVDRLTLVAWVAHLMWFGAGRSDAAILRATYEAVTSDDEDTFTDIAGWADAYRPTPELALESNAQGEAFLTTVDAAWPAIDLAPWRTALVAADRPTAYPVAVGAAAALARIPMPMALSAYLHGFAANLVSAAVRLIPLGQTDGQRVMAELEETVLAVADVIARKGRVTLPDDLGAAAPMADWASMKHETQYTRLFRS